MNLDVITIPCPTEERPFLRTQKNSPTEHEGRASTLTDPIMGTEIPCTDRIPSPTTPTSVHKLRPGDIKVVAAVGDSLTAGNGVGAKGDNLFLVMSEYRGLSWSIGGDENITTVTTLPNILKEFNPNVTGFSTGIGNQNTPGAFLNQAVAGAKSGGIPGQARRLIDIMKNDSTVDFENDWKLVTLFIGGNDLCQYCNDRAALSPQNYSYHMMTSLDMLYKEVPRVIVNVMEILEIEGLRRIKRDSFGCNTLQKYVCPCFLLAGEDSSELAEVKRINRELQVETERLVYGDRYDGREDFAVVVQPFFQNTVVPLNADSRPDDTYFSADCFHFSERGHSDMAAALWNNMLEPVGKKQTYNNFTYGRKNIKCPSEEHPYIFTKENSVPISTTATAPTTHSTTLPLTSNCTDNVPGWLAAVLAITGILIGGGVTWLLLSCGAKRSKRVMTFAGEMTSTTF
ncbi:Phospholipase B1, membrane-associated [Collichthys lucidus]|uniref:Phospholipase B1, membrane-associated n=1 Tax=Collichthys lucidus TaxID=240159 RepID=A0A4U5VFB0_COLLU|nr:Phospholipase B1, membrane-associated [Collichthys lucidus]